MTPDADSELLGWDDSVSPPRLTMRGDWTLDNYAVLGQRIALFRTGAGSVTAGAQGSQVDLSGPGALDTAGASRLFELLGTASQVIEWTLQHGSPLQPGTE